LAAELFLAKAVQVVEAESQRFRRSNRGRLVCNSPQLHAFVAFRLHQILAFPFSSNAKLGFEIKACLPKCFGHPLPLHLAWATSIVPEGSSMRNYILALMCVFFISSSAVAKDWKAVLAMLEQTPQTPEVIKKKAEACSNLAVEAYKNKDSSQAAMWLKKAAELDPTGGHQNRLVEILMKENKSALDKEAKKQKVRDLEASFSKTTDSFFDVRFQNTVDQKADAGLRVGMLTARNLIAKEYRFTPRKKTTVLVYSSAEFSSLQDGRPCSCNPESIRLPLDGTENLQAAIAHFFHQYTHTAIHTLGRGRCPNWLNEGLSQVQEFKIRRKPLAALKEASDQDKLLALEELDEAISSNDPQRIELGYQQSYSTASFLTEVFGSEKVRQLLKELGRKQTLEVALNKTCGISVQQLHAGWKAWLPTQLK